MPKLSKIQKVDETQDVEVPFEDGEVLHVVCYPNRFTGKRQRDLRAVDEDDYERQAELFFEVLKEWDLEGDDGKVLPFNAETAELLSSKTTIRLFTEIMDEITPDPKTRKRSRGR